MSKLNHTSPKITPFLWFDNNAEDAMNFYTSVFKNSSIDSINRINNEGRHSEGSIMICSFTLEGQKFMALNAGPHFKFNEAAYARRAFLTYYTGNILRTSSAQQIANMRKETRSLDNCRS